MKYPIKSNAMTRVENGTSTTESLHKDSKTDMYHETSEEKSILSKIKAISPTAFNNSASEDKSQLEDLVSNGKLWQHSCSIRVCLQFSKVRSKQRWTCSEILQLRTLYRLSTRWMRSELIQFGQWTSQKLAEMTVVN